MDRVDYYDYIRSDAWKARAHAAKQRAGYRCQICNRPAGRGVVLDAHHRTYARLGHEQPDDITVLCHDCHALYEQNKRLSKPPAPTTRPTAAVTTFQAAVPVQPLPEQATRGRGGRRQGRSRSGGIAVAVIVVVSFFLCRAIAGVPPVSTVATEPPLRITPTPRPTQAQRRVVLATPTPAGAISRLGSSPGLASGTGVEARAAQAKPLAGSF